MAGAWTQPKGHGQYIISNYYYIADNLYDNQGRPQAQQRYAKYSFNPYIEYGLTDIFTLGANLMFERAGQQLSTGGVTYSYGIGDSEFFLRARVWQQGNAVVSVTPLVKLPSPAPTDIRPRIGSAYPDAALGVTGGYGFDFRGQHHFADASAMYRYRYGEPENQINLSATLGLHLTPRWMLMPQLFVTRRAKSPQTVNYTQSSGDDYDAAKAQLSLLFEFNRKMAVQAGVYGEVDGKNTGKGRGVVFSVWRKF